MKKYNLKGFKFLSVLLVFALLNTLITVTPLARDTSNVKSISFSVTDISLTAGGKKQKLIATVLPENATNKSVVWNSSDESIAKVDNDGMVTPISEGVAIITVKTVVGGLRAYCIVNVNKAEVIKVQSMSFDKHELKIKKGETSAITAKVLPDNATVNAVTWVSGDPSVAKVDYKGNITAVSKGTVGIVGKTVDGNFSDYCIVTVIDKVDSVSVTPTSASIKLGGAPVKATASISPASVKNKNVTWSSSNSSVAAVSSNGLIYAVGKGSAQITATSDEDNTIKGSCSVTVTADEVNQNTDVTAVTMNTNSYNMNVGDKYKLAAVVKPDNASDKTLIWSSTDAKIASAAQDGTVSALSKGTAVIFAKSIDNVHGAYCLITVTDKPVVKVQGISLDKNSLQLSSGSTASLKATVMPDSATNKNVTWINGDKSVASVDSAGNITAGVPGNTVIIAKTEDGNFTAYCLVKVVENIQGISLDKSSISFNLGDSPQTIRAVVNPSTAKEKRVVWTSSNAAAAVVDYTGKVFPVGEGSAIITATSVADSSKIASCSVIVKSQHSVTGIKLDKSSANMNVGDTIRLNATVTPDNAELKTVSWSTTDSSVISVGSDGTVKALSKGIVFAVARTADGSYGAACAINVADAPIVKVTGLSLDKTELNIAAGDKTALKATVSPDNATVKQVYWMSGDTSIATVDDNGNINAVAPGRTIVIARTVDGNKIAYCNVNVMEKIDSVTVNPSSVTMQLGSAPVKLSAVISPSTIANKSVIWKSSNTSVVQVGSDGMVYSVGAGSASVTATSKEDGTKSGSCTVTVLATDINKGVPVTGITMNSQSADLVVGKTLNLSVSVKPDNATDKSVKWLSSDESIAKVDNSGVVTAVAKGFAFIFAKTNDGGYGAYCLVNVGDAPVINPTGITLNMKQAKIKVGTQATLTATITPSDVTEKGIQWTSGDESIARVDNNGVITGVGRGKTVIMVRTLKGNYIDLCNVTVYENIDSVTLDKNSIQMTLGDPSVKLTATVNPSTAVNKNVIWTSSNTSVAIVGSDGTVAAVGGGTATITATSAEDGSKLASCSVTVNINPGGVIITPGN